MVILHIAYIRNTSYNGVSVVVPHHINTQSKYAETGLINIYKEKINGIENQFEYDYDFKIKNLPSPFNKPDIVVFHECYRIQYIKIYKELLKNNIPYVILPHGELAIGAQKKKRLKKFIANLLLFNRFIKKSKAIQCLSQNEYDNVRFKANKIVSTNGVYLPGETKDSFRDSSLKFVYIGRLDPYHKGLDLLLDAIVEIKQTIVDNKVKFYLYGPEYAANPILPELISSRNLSDIVLWMGPVDGKEKKKALLDSDIFIQTSRFEGMPMGILEALSYGVPCLATEGTNLTKEISKYDAGWVCETDSHSIALSILNAISDVDDFKNKSIHAKKLIEDNFEWDKISHSAIVKYNDLLK